MKYLMRMLLILSVCPLLEAGCARNEPTKEEIKDMLLIAHRGGASLGNENSLSCITAGVASGVDLIEIDVHQTSDGQIVVCHDATLNRTTTGRGKIRKMTLDLIRSFRIKDREGNPTEECIPTLEEVLNVLGEQCGLLLEIKRQKNGHEGIEANVLRILKEHNALERTVIQSFDDRVLEKIHDLEPQVRIEKLLIFYIPGLNILFDGSLTGFSWDKYDYVASFNFHHAFLGKSFLNELHARGKQAKVWTVNNPKDFPDIPVDGIITDHPAEFLRLLGRKTDSLSQ